MLKSPQNVNLFKISIYLKNGAKYENRDLVEYPFSSFQYEAIAFWDSDKIMIYHMSEIEHVELFEDKNDI